MRHLTHLGLTPSEAHSGPGSSYLNGIVCPLEQDIGLLTERPLSSALGNLYLFSSDQIRDGTEPNPNLWF